MHAQIPGIEIIAEKSVQVTNEEQSIIWDGYGLRVRIPCGSLPKGRSHCQLKIGVAVSGEFQLPVNGIPTSAVYWLSHDLQEELQNPITLEMQHCATNSALNHLCVVRASTLSHNLPYKFEQSKVPFSPRILAMVLSNFVISACSPRVGCQFGGVFGPPFYLLLSIALYYILQMLQTSVLNRISIFFKTWIHILG